MRTIRFDRRIDGTESISPSMQKKIASYKKSFKDVDSMESLQEVVSTLLESPKTRDGKLRKNDISALRIIVQKTSRDLDFDKNSYIKLDETILEKAKTVLTNDKTTVEIVGNKPAEKRTMEEEPDREETQEEEEEAPTQSSSKRSREEEDVADDIPDKDEPAAQEDKQQESIDTEEAQPTEEVVQEEETKSEEVVQEEETKSEILPDIPLTNPQDIGEKEAPVVEDPIQLVDQEAADTLPPGAVPEGEDAPQPTGENIDPATLQEQPVGGVAEEEEQQELPDYEDLSDIEVEDGYFFEDEGTASTPSTGDDFTQDEAILVHFEATSGETQDALIRSMIDTAMDVSGLSRREAEEFVSDMLSMESSMDIDPQTEPLLEEEEKTSDDQESTMAIAPETEQGDVEQGDVEQQADMEVDQETPEKESDAPDVDMKEPSKSLVNQQERERKKVDETEVKRNKQIQKETIQKEKETKQLDMDRVKRDKRLKVLNAHYASIFGREMTEGMKEDLNMEKKTNDLIRVYMGRIALKTLAGLKEQRASVHSIINSGSAKSAFALDVLNKPIVSKEINKEVDDQLVADTIRKSIYEGRLRSAGDIASEVAVFTRKNIERIREQLDPSNAISKFIYPTFRDPDTFNIVKYRSDADGNIIINKETGQPIIESISAMNRDDGKKLLDQRQAVDATDTPSPYYPIYGKQSRRYFSKNEFNYLGRMFQGPAGKARGTIPKPLNMASDIKTMLDEMSSALELEKVDVHHNKLYRQWSELQILKSSFHRYNQFAEYQYVQDKKELQTDGTLVDPDAMDSAAKLLQNVTVQKLLDLLASNKKNEMEQTSGAFNQASGTNVTDLKDKQMQGQPPPGPDDMDTSKTAQELGAEDLAEEETKESQGLNSWLRKAGGGWYQGVAPLEVYKPGILSAWGGEDDRMKDA